MSFGTSSGRFVIRGLILAALLLSLGPATTAGVGNIDDTDRFCWAENAGWWNFKPTHGGVSVQGTHLFGFAWHEAVGWIKLGAAGGGPYANTGVANWGVNHDGAGNLSGYAWSENAGWINFGPTHGGVTISTTSGVFDGYAWSENLGWIHFRHTAFPIYEVMAVGCPINGTDNDFDGTLDCDDPDDDNDGVPDHSDPNPFDPSICGDTDGDTCDDCSIGTDGFGPLPDNDPANDGTDLPDMDGTCNFGDPDDDNDGVPDGQDPQSLNPNICGDTDGDTCDDCSVGTDGTGPLSDSDPSNDGPDFDGDGLCDAGDPDDDNDGALDPDDSDDFDRFVCSDIEPDNCEDCLSGTFDPANDGFDFDSDGLCNSGDPDDDNDGSPDEEDSADDDPNVCNDSDGDLCDDCSNGFDDPADDGPDTDADGICDVGDLDDDNDGVEDGGDTDPVDPDICEDADADGCEDCVIGTDDFGPLPDNLPQDDGPDNDLDGACDFGDDDDDNDGTLDVDDGCPFDPEKIAPGVCGCFVPDDDSDADSFADCVDNCPDIPNDQTDQDTDGAGDPCDCRPADGSFWRVPGPIDSLRLDHTGGEFGTTTLTWGEPTDRGALVHVPLLYDAILATDFADFVSSGICLETDETDQEAVDTTPALLPLFYVVRAEHECGEGSGGEGVGGADRPVVSCP